MRPAPPVVRPPLALAAVLAVALASAPAAARAQFATTNVQVLEGFDFHDQLLGTDTRSGRMTTVTLNHFSTWKYGDNFAFVDLQSGKFRSGIDATLYAEWHPRVFVNRLLGVKGSVLGFKDLGAAFEVNQGNGFYAYMAGVGGDLALPGAAVVGVNVYYRHDSVQIPAVAGVLRILHDTWQASPFWTVRFAAGPVPLVFTGFVDVFGTNDSKDVDVMAQPQLLADVLAPFGGPRETLLVGIEWYLHHYQLGPENRLSSVPQALVQWTLH